MVHPISRGVFLFFLSFIINNAFAQHIELSFNDKREFKIAQFTDLHLADKEESLSDQTFAVVQSVLDTEKPDLAVITGDVVTKPPVRDWWLKLAQIFGKNKTPWAVALGNHDGRDAGTTRDEVFDLISDLPFFVGEKGKGQLAGVGNYILPIKSKEKDKTALLIYVMDSHNRPSKKEYGHWDWIKDDQIEWYKRNREAYRIDNGGNLIPSVSFFHIPLPEFDEIAGGLKTIGTKGEEVSSPKINSGLFAAFLEGKDMTGVFTGHDHDNDYIGIHYGIALAFGRATGVEAYGKLERGARIIRFYQDEFKFDSWIRTPKGAELYFYYPSGISSADEKELESLPALNPSTELENGLSYAYYEGGRFKKVADIRAKGKKMEEGVLPNFSIQSAKVGDSLAFVYKGWIKIPETGVYQFYTYSDDGSVLFIDDQMVVDNDGSHNALRKEGKIKLEAGFHRIQLEYFQDYMGKFLEVGWSSRAIREEPVPKEVLFIEKEQ